MKKQVFDFDEATVTVTPKKHVNKDNEHSRKNIKVSEEMKNDNKAYTSEFLKKYVK